MVIHVVKAGETVYGIALRYGVSPGSVMENNTVPEDGTLAVGQALLILQPEETYVLQGGESLESVARDFSVSERTLYRNNPSLITDPTLYPGRQLVISYGEAGRGRIDTGGYAYPFIEEQTLARSLPYLSELTVFTYGFDKDGTLIAPQADDRPAIEEAKRAGVRSLLLLSTLGPEGTFDNSLTTALFSYAETEERLITSLLEVMREKGYDGLEIDFEYVEPAQREDYAAFVARATERMNASGYPVTVALAPKVSRDQPGLLYEAHDYAALGAAANSVLIMAYEWGYTYGPPMAVAPIDKVRRVAEYAASEIPREKIRLGVPNYGYDWTLPYEPGSAARSLFSAEAVSLAQRTGSEIFFDGIAASPYFNYTDEEGRAHVVWSEDIRSYSAKLDLISELGFSGYSVWTVMRSAKDLFLLTNGLYTINGAE